MSGQHARVTIRDVASAAGVSPSTVSKSLNGNGQLSDATRQRVLSAAEELGFTPNQIARGLTMQRTFTVGVLSTDTYGRFTMPILSGAEDALGEGEVSMLLAESRGDSIREAHFLRTLLGRRVDGIIVTGRSSNARDSIGELPVPVVYALGPSRGESDFSVVPDDRGGASRAVRHLTSTGHGVIGIVAGPRRHLANQHRVNGAEAALADVGLESAGDGPLYGEWTEAWGREAAAHLVTRVPELDAVMCASDQIARGVCEHLREQGREVPGEIAVVGVDNWDVMVNACRPALTSVDLNLRHVGYTATTHLLNAVTGNPLPTGIELVDCSLIVRQST